MEFTFSLSLSLSFYFQPLFCFDVAESGTSQSAASSTGQMRGPLRGGLSFIAVITVVIVKKKHWTLQTREQNKKSRPATERKRERNYYKTKPFYEREANAKKNIYLYI